MFAAPLVLFLPEEAVQQLRHQEVRLDQWGVEYVVRSPNVLEPLLESALRCLILDRPARVFKALQEPDSSHVTGAALNSVPC